MSVLVNKVAASPIVCPSALVSSINEDNGITPVCEWITVDDKTDLTLSFETSLSSGEDSSLESLIDGFSCPEVPGLGNDVLDNVTAALSGSPGPNTNDVLTFDGTSWGPAPGVEYNNRVYVGHFIVTGSGTKTISGLPFQPNQVQFHVTFPVYSANVEEAGPANQNSDKNSSGHAFGYVRDDGAITQQASASIGTGNSINAVRYSSSSSHCVFISPGDQNGNEMAQISISFSSWNSDGFDLDVETFSSVEEGAVLVYFIATRDEKILDLSGANLNDLLDVSVPSPSTDDVLTYNGSGWVPQATSGGGTFSEFDYDEDLDWSSTSSTSWQRKLRLTTQNLPAGLYRIGWSYRWHRDADNRDYAARVELNNTTDIMLHEEEPSDSDDNQKLRVGGFAYHSLSGINTIDIDFRNVQGGSTSYMAEARLEIWKVSDDTSYTPGDVPDDYDD